MNKTFASLLLIFLTLSQTIVCEIKPYNVDEFMKKLEEKNPAQPEFIQAAREVIESIIDVVNSNPKYLKNKILDRIIEPNIIHQFKVEWEDDNLLAESIGNSLEDAATRLVPEISQIKQTLKDRGLKIVLMSGSGSTVFALSTELSSLRKVAKQLENHYFVEITKVLKK